VAIAAVIAAITGVSSPPGLTDPAQAALISLFIDLVSSNATSSPAKYSLAGARLALEWFGEVKRRL
jgi:hypothetical protein